jgi:hypothetical protein
MDVNASGHNNIYWESVSFVYTKTSSLLLGQLNQAWRIEWILWLLREVLEMRT